MADCEKRAVLILNAARKRGDENLPTCWAEAIRSKADYNKTRPWKHGGKLA